MTLNVQLHVDFQLHRKSRTQRHVLYPMRFWVPDEKVSWLTEFPDYCPLEFNAPIVLDKNTPWADPQDITKVTHSFISFLGEVKLDEYGIPMNPIGRTGIKGRGVLGKWGANFAVDAIITTINAENNLMVLSITRKDTGESAFPGGMVDPGESVFKTRNRELSEELSVKEDDLTKPMYESIVSRGYVDDPRNTDNAWLETTAIHTHLSFEIANKMHLKAGDDAADFSWIKITKENIQGFYASHGLTLIKALNELALSKNPNLAKFTIDLLKKEFDS